MQTSRIKVKTLQKIFYNYYGSEKADDIQLYLKKKNTICFNNHLIIKRMNNPVLWKVLHNLSQKPTKKIMYGLYMFSSLF